MFSFFRKPALPVQQQQHTPSPSLPETPPPHNAIQAHSPALSPSRSPTPDDAEEEITDPTALHALISSIPPKTLHAYTLSHLCPPPPQLIPFPFPSTGVSSSPYDLPNPNNTASLLSFSRSSPSTQVAQPPSPKTLTHLTKFFASLVPPPKLHCVRCHAAYFELENSDTACRVQHDDDSAIVERVGARGGSKGAGVYETLYTCCSQSVEGEGDMGPPDGWCYEGMHTTDTKRARFRADSTPSSDKLTSCAQLRCFPDPSDSLGSGNNVRSQRRQERGHGRNASSSTGTGVRGSPTRRRGAPNSNSQLNLNPAPVASSSVKGHAKKPSASASASALSTSTTSTPQNQTPQSQARAKPMSAMKPMSGITTTTTATTTTAMETAASGPAESSSARKRKRVVSLAPSAVLEGGGGGGEMDVYMDSEDVDTNANANAKGKGKAKAKSTPPKPSKPSKSTTTTITTTSTSTARRPTKRAKPVSAEFVVSEDDEREDEMDVDNERDNKAEIEARKEEEEEEEEEEENEEMGDEVIVKPRHTNGKGKGPVALEPLSSTSTTAATSPPAAAVNPRKNTPFRRDLTPETKTSPSRGRRTIVEVEIVSRSPSRVGARDRVGAGASPSRAGVPRAGGDKDETAEQGRRDESVEKPRKRYGRANAKTSAKTRTRALGEVVGSSVYGEI